MHGSLEGDEISDDGVVNEWVSRLACSQDNSKERVVMVGIEIKVRVIEIGLGQPKGWIVARMRQFDRGCIEVSWETKRYGYNIRNRTTNRG